MVLGHYRTYPLEILTLSRFYLLLFQNFFMKSLLTFSIQIEPFLQVHHFVKNVYIKVKNLRALPTIFSRLKCRLTCYS